MKITRLNVKVKPREGYHTLPAGSVSLEDWGEVDGPYPWSFLYEYPLRDRVIFTEDVEVRRGELSLIDLLTLGRKHYKAIYDTVTMKKMDGPLESEEVVGDNPYGICGHGIGDLYFEGVHVDAYARVVYWVIGS